ncbi:D-lactate dehydrogenase (cytochrome) [Apiospora arundinis]
MGVSVCIAVSLASGMITSTPRDPNAQLQLPLSLPSPSFRSNLGKANLEAAWTRFQHMARRVVVHDQGLTPLPHCQADPPSPRVQQLRIVSIPTAGGSPGHEGLPPPQDPHHRLQWRHTAWRVPSPRPAAASASATSAAWTIVPLGTNAYRYGTVRESVLSLTVVLADRTIIKTRQRPRKSSTSYDLTKLFIGSEGTLSISAEATLKVTVKPQSASVAVCSFGTIVSHGRSASSVTIASHRRSRSADDDRSIGQHASMTKKVWKESPTLF